MTTNSTTRNRPTVGRYRHLLLATSVMTYLLIVAGGTVCVTGSGLGCPDWPGCYGQVVPPMRIDSIIEYSHRFIALLAGPLIFAAAIVGLVKFRSMRWLSRPVTISIVFLLAVVVFGALAVVRGLEPGLAVLDLGSALTVLALVVTSTVLAFHYHRDPTLPDRLSFRTPFARLTLFAGAGLFLLLVSGILAAGSGSITRCLGWPLYGGELTSIDPSGWFQTTRRVFAGLVGLLVVAVVVQAWRTQREQRQLLVPATVLGALFLLEMVLGVLLTTVSSSALLLVVYVAVTTAMWACTVVLAVNTGLLAPEPATEAFRAAQPATY